MLAVSLYTDLNQAGNELNIYYLLNLVILITKRIMQLLFSILSAVTAVVVSGQLFDKNLNGHWGQFKDVFRKQYKTDEEFKRRLVWESNVREIERHNREFDLGMHSYTLGLNEYADWSGEEFQRYLLGAKRGNASEITYKRTFVPRVRSQLPKDIDWRSKGVISPVKNQGQCGSCWAFSTTGALEAYHAMATGYITPLSEQNLIDCSRSEGNNGCHGGWPARAMMYVAKNKGIDKESAYPYLMKDGYSCRFSKSAVSGIDFGAVRVKADSEDDLQAAVATAGPVTVCIDATLKSWHLYKSGVYDNSTCHNTMAKLDHAVLVVGYGNENGKDYWLVKNSWGGSWGDNGYIKMATKMMKLAIVLGLVACAFADPNLDAQWNLFKKTHNKVYTQIEETMRRIIFERNVQRIQSHNLEADMGLHTYRLGMNKYGDLTDEEYRTLLGYRMTNTTRSSSGTFMAPSNMVLPDSVDWRPKGYVTPIKDQKQCGSCWAFSATGSLEGQTFKKTGKLPSLSEQNLVDCSTKEGNHGCGGGLMDLAFKYIKVNDGIDTEMSYPYEAKNDKCRYKSADKGGEDTGFMDIKRGSEKDLQSAVATVGPISVAIDAGHFSFRMYKTGVYYEPKCSSVRLDHGVLAVGYGSENMQDYWIVKNSWGKSWGSEGYIKMARNRDNQCGIATQSSYPLV
ncbi:unnamed protein product [Owenia fusiformis]|uniref:Cathepsin L n=1 Tax=Owenia fusiformis TaxID=6347 RepID=A0A8S4P823_OWEFU|nr:unnamed protein product [Owenia fusiformis]